MSSAVFWKSPPWHHLIAVPQVNCSKYDPPKCSSLPLERSRFPTWRMVPWAPTSPHPNCILISSAVLAQLMRMTNSQSHRQTDHTGMYFTELENYFLFLAAILLNGELYKRAVIQAIVVKWKCILLSLVPSVLWRCWLGGRKGIRPVKNKVVGCWHGYLSGARCRLAYCPADATATHCLLLQ